MKIGVWANDGSPLGITYDDIYARNGRIGIGGAELALFTVLEGLAKRGHEVVLFNNPEKLTKDWEVQQAHHNQFHLYKDYFDTFVVFRSPAPIINYIKSKKKVWWSTDQATVGNFKAFSQKMDNLVLISQTHADSFWARYRIRETSKLKVDILDLPVRTEEYKHIFEKEPNHFIYTSVPDRGLSFLLFLWPKIKKEIPEAKLSITSDYRLWGNMHPGNNHWKDSVETLEGIDFLGAIPREQLVELQLKADMLLYPCIYEELFCIACAEAQVAGAFPITSNFGALKTTNTTSGLLGHPKKDEFRKDFLDKVVYMSRNRKELEKERVNMIVSSTERFSLDTILNKWEEILCPE